MAQTATDAVQVPAGRKAKRPARGGHLRTDAAQSRAAIALDLLPLLAPYRKRGRLSVRVEQMPPLARLSAGRNNGDNSWSLASDELEELTFQPPDNFAAPHTLAIRIIVYAGGEASTGTLIDYEISPDGSGGAAIPAAAAPDGEDAGEDAGKDAREQLQSLRDALAQMTDLVAQRDAALSAAKDESEAARAELVLVREAWQKELDARVAAIETDAARRTAEASEQAARERDAALAKAEERWKAAEATRLAAAEAKWRKDAGAALAQARAEADRGRAGGETEIRALKDDLAAMRESLRARDRDLTQAHAAIKKVEAGAAQTQRDAILKAEATWKASEAARLAAAEAGWKTESEQTRADAHAASEKAAAEGQTEINRLREETGTLRQRLAERDAAIARLEAGGAAADAQREQEQRNALAAAEERGKDQAARAMADLAARCARTEAELRAATEGADAAKAEDERLREECTTLRITLAAREGELEQARAATAASARLVETAPASGPLEAALAEATERYEIAEAALIDLRKRASPHGAAETERLRDEVATLQTILDHRDAELARAQVAAQRWYEYQSGGGAAPERGAGRNTRRPTNDNDDDAPRQRGMLRDVVIVMAVVVAAILFYPRVVASLPYQWQAMLPDFMSDAGTASDDAPIPASARSPAAPPAAVAATTDDAVTITRGVNLRAGPSARTDAITTLKAGTAVSKIEENGGWVHVRVPAQDGEKEARTGWVFNTYLKAASEPAAAQSRAPH